MPADALRVRVRGVNNSIESAHELDFFLLGERSLVKRNQRAVHKEVFQAALGRNAHAHGYARIRQELRELASLGRAPENQYVRCLRHGISA